MTSGGLVPNFIGENSVEAGFSAVLWTIWLERAQRTFQGTSKEAKAIVDIDVFKVALWQQDARTFRATIFMGSWEAALPTEGEGGGGVYKRGESGWDW